MSVSRLTAATLPGLALSLGLLCAPALHADEVVYATTGGLMRQKLEEHMYIPFKAATGTEIIPFDIEVPDQWARAEGMLRSGKVEFDIVTATGPDLVARADMLMDIDCDALKNVKEFGLPGSCEAKGVARTTGGMVLSYNKEVFKDKAPQSWADFWNIADFPGPRGLPDTGDRDWWLPAVALLADGVAPDQIFPMDLDRAYKKLDEIKPHISVWWKTGNQVAQIMRDAEVVMTMSYSGRSLAAIKDGAPWDIAWNGGIRDTGYFSVLKNAPNAEGALKFIDFFYGNADGQPEFMRAALYATNATNGLSKLDEAEQKLFATYPENYAQLLKPEFKWIGENRDALRARWTEWLAQ
ncbi:extracellular solute-binding protein [Falsigemmobacter faecalis]|uniref:Extracellular solute-binding protein n=1 Tax=Falsigemmobacter faecalis TaxID=2488730 RepID=A0A3P3DR34_9RHOB|nr:extracellular solute-binding protein [Falsigemmobacter faecalis]RRH76136.1 extracellular solute-binding protein [Falsigemmobacter faecalis]